MSLFLALLMEGIVTLDVGEGSREESMESEEGLDFPEWLGTMWC